MRIKNWHKFQHYKKRNPPWVKLHVSMLSSEDWVMLDDASKLLACVCLMVASKFDGEIPTSASPAYFKRVAYLETLPNFKPLIDCGFLVETLATASNDDTTQATARPEAEQSRAETEKGYGFEGKIVRLSLTDFKNWKAAYSFLDLGAELIARDVYLASSDATDEDRKRWFISTSKYLANRNSEAKGKCTNVSRAPNGAVRHSVNDPYAGMD